MARGTVMMMMTGLSTSRTLSSTSRQIHQALLMENDLILKERRHKYILVFIDYLKNHFIRQSFLLIDVYAFYDLKAFSLTRMIVHRQDKKIIAHQYGSQHDA